jgi:hypothetical protein
MNIRNYTGHPITVFDTDISHPPCGKVIRARPEDTSVKNNNINKLNTYLGAPLTLVQLGNPTIGDVGSKSQQSIVFSWLEDNKDTIVLVSRNAGESLVRYFSSASLDEWNIIIVCPHKNVWDKETNASKGCQAFSLLNNIGDEN